MRRGVGVVLTVLGAAVLLSITGMAVAYLLLAREPPVARDSTLVLRPGGELHEVLPNDVAGQVLRRGGTNTVRAFVELMRKAARDSRITAVVLKPGSIDLPYWGKVQELRQAVVDFRKSGKPVVAYLEYGGDREYYLASAADRVFLMPTSPLDLTGVASYEIFLRGTLDKIGAYPDMLHIGDYKTAPNQLTEATYTPAHREMAESLNRDMYEQLVRGIADARKKSEAEVRALIDEGPFLPEDALRAGLVDDLVYEDQVDDKVKAIRKSDRMTTIDAEDYSRISPSSVGLVPISRVAVIYAAGTIASGKSRFDPVNGPVVGSETLVEQIRAARQDASIKAIVLRVDSPGGSSIASDVIWRELTITRDQKPSRPLVTSMADLAASGGYYIGMPAQVIVAQPATLTGSIGIFTGKIVTGGTFQKLGANVEGLSVGRRAQMNSSARRYTPDERAKVEEQMQAFYDQFVEKAASARHTTPEKIDAVAQGRVWTGQQARQHGLVDVLGGLDTAVMIAKQRAMIPADEEVELVIYPPRRTFYEMLADQFVGATAGLGVNPLGLVLGRSEQRAIAAITAPLRLFRRGEPLALMLYAFVR